MTVGEFLKVCYEDKFMLQDEVYDIGYMSKDGLEKYFSNYEIQKFWLDQDQHEICILLADV